MAQTQLLQSLRRFDSSQWRPLTASRCAGALAIVLFGSILLKEPGAGVLACLGALYAGLGSFNGSYPDRIKRMLVVSFALGFVTYAGSILSAHPIERVVTVGVVAFLMAIFSTRSAVANTISIQITAVLVVLSGIPSTAQNPLGNGLSVLVGGLIQTAMLLAVLPFWPHSQERRVVSAAIETLSQFVGSGVKRQGDTSIPDGQPFQDAWSLIDEAEAHGLTPERRFLKEELRIAEQLRAELVGLNGAYTALTDSGQPAEKERQAMVELQRSLHVLAESLQSGAPYPAKQIEAAGDGADFWRWLHYVQVGIGRAGQLAPAQFVQEPRPIRLRKLSDKPAGRKWHFPFPTTRALWSLISRHAGRYAVCIGGATWLSEAWKVHHSYWLPLTTSLILRPDYATTLNRGVARVTGTLFGVLLAGVFAFAVHRGGWIAPIELIVAGWLACALYLANYVLYATSITLYVIFSVSSSGIPQRTDAFQRMEATLAGVVVCLAVSILWPIWESRKIRAVLKDALDAQIAYGEDLSAHVGSTVSEDTVDSRRQARSLRIEAERVVNAGAIEPFWSRKDSHQRAHEFMIEVDRNAAGLLALQAEAAEVGPEGMPGLRSRIAGALDEARRLSEAVTEAKLSHG